ncbi:Biopolymer transport protein ExbB [Sedimentisphaera cyanobacteriorum]|uniref:Biopolymer transport protein ExbB n=1 Tax=Sedimentisphaera cyanobacteriorum TaxID=1940790 RepID=A0A1Q2HQQ3_9BACT|nr:MotA/TolQ/ExbB proton channel family protein [Sedimentisphaera cyanobacteriorum]AQQ09710.1 Biopolymer transport protein ExbB [Sedimentisphaera cyanobacteriorum]
MPEVLREHITALSEQAVSIWLSGGWSMVAIAFIAIVMFSLSVNVQLKLSAKGFKKVKEKAWRHWINHPKKRQGHIGEILDFVESASTVEEMRSYFEELHSRETKPFVRDLRVIKICVSAAPLLGLLGTVTGMLSTFDALAKGSGGDKTMGMVAEGISEALVTTETGLIIALSGLLFSYIITRKFESYKAFLAHMETVCTQKLHKKNLKN